jgi:ubiquinone/menaquinone biosynthesis C-methylase UbiE
MVSPFHLYGWVCGRELTANLLNFQFLPAFYARRDITRDGAKLKGTLLDLGCGSQPYRQYLKGVARYVGLDYPLTRECLTHKVKPEVHGDARTLPFADQSFDGVLCSQVLEHVDRPDTVVQEMSRVLKLGGVGLISVPFFYNLHMEPHDYFRFSPYGIQELLEKSGLAVRQLRGQGGIGTLLVQMFHNWLFSGLAHRARRHMLQKALVTMVLPLLFLLSTLDNLVGLGLDHLNPNDLRFTPNLWVVAEKVSS